jgi:PAS domain S-box-containing protein
MKKPNILIVEDETIVAEDTRDALIEVGYTVQDIAGSGEEAIEQAKTLKPDLVLMDINLKGSIDGIQAAAKINVKLNIPVVYVTAYTDRKTLDRIKSTNPYGFILKPYKIKELLSVIEITLYKHEKEKELGKYQKHLEELVQERTAELRESNKRMAIEIEKRNQIEQELSQKEEFYRALYNLSPSGIVLENINGEVIEANPAFCQVLGYPKEELIGMNIRQLAHDDASIEVEDNIGKIISGKHLNHIVKNVKKDGSICYVNLNEKKVTLPNGDYGILCVIEDLTEKLGIEEALQESEDRYKRLVENIAEGLAAVDANENFTFANSSLCEIFGTTAEEIIGSNISEYISPEDYELIKKQSVLRKEGVSSSYELTIARKNDEKKRNLLVSVNPIFDSQHKHIGGSAIVSDISDRKEVDEALKQRVKFENLVSQLSTHFISLTPDEIDHGIDYALQVLAELIGADCSVINIFLDDHDFFNVSNKWCAKEHDMLLGFYQGALNDCVKAMLAKLKNAEIDTVVDCDSMSAESELLKKLMQEFNIQSFIHLPLIGRKGVIGFLGFNSSNPDMEWPKEIVNLLKIAREMFINAFERKQAESERTKLESQMHQLQKMEAIGTLAGGVAHDFNNILAVITGYVEMVIEDMAPDDGSQQYMQSIYEAAIRAKELVKQILAFSRHDKLDIEIVELNSIISEALNFLKASILPTIDICYKVCDKNVTVLADPSQIHQIIMNLSTNAYQSMGEKGGSLTIELDVVDFASQDSAENHNLNPGEYARLRVTDTGSGMDLEIKKRIFDPFFTTKEVGEGTGLGLSVIHGIVETLKGTITVDSTLGKGSAFNVYIPLSSEVADELIDANSTIQLGDERILLVDDEKPFLDMSVKMLTRLGYHITAFTDSVEALKSFEDNPDSYDLVITDQIMPDLSGAELSTKLLQIRPEIPIVLVSGYSGDVTPEIAAKIGIAKYINKPIIRMELARAIRDVLET